MLSCTLLLLTPHRSKQESERALEGVKLKGLVQARTLERTLNSYFQTLQAAVPLDQLKTAIPRYLKEINSNMIQTSKKSEIPLDKFKTLEEHKATFALMKKEKRQIQDDDAEFDKTVKVLRQDLQQA